MAQASQLIAAAASDGGKNLVINMVALLLGSTLLAGIFTTVLGNARIAATARRDRYAQVVRALVAWVEYPYRIRRRTDDDPATLTALADRGHAIQEQLAELRAWVTAESRTVAYVLDRCLTDLNRLVGPACVEAWQQNPITNPGAMVLRDFGPRDTAKIIAKLECAITYRFGIRRLMWRSWVLRRLRKHDS